MVKEWVKLLLLCVCACVRAQTTLSHLHEGTIMNDELRNTWKEAYFKHQDVGITMVTQT
jgi:hypothetical protein